MSLRYKFLVDTGTPEAAAAAEDLRRGRVRFTGTGRTKQAMKDECDINNIMAKYQRTGTISHFAKHEASYGFAPAVTLQESFEIVEKAREMFDELPSSVRKRFGNDVVGFLAFVQDPTNKDAMAEMGLTKPAVKVDVPVAVPDPNPKP